MCKSVESTNTYKILISTHQSICVNAAVVEWIYELCTIITNTRINVWHESALRHQTVCVGVFRKRGGDAIEMLFSGPQGNKDAHKVG